MTSSSFDFVRALCSTVDVDELCESELVSILEATLKTNPDVLHEEDSFGYTLLHFAASRRSPGFCKLLVDVNPDLVKSVDNQDQLPFHDACTGGNAATAKYLYDIYPESINIPDKKGFYPLLTFAEYGPKNEEAIELTQFLLKHDQGAISKSNNPGILPLHSACRRSSLTVVKLIFDAYPEAIHIRDRSQWTPLDIARHHQNENMRRDLPSFLERQMDLERQAREDRTPDNHGRLPIHRALQNRDSSVGAIKLMMAANPASIAVDDKQGLTLLHIACQRDNLDSVKYIMGINQDLLKVPDLGGNLPLHYACMAGICDIISLIIERSSFGVMLQNSANQIPIELLLLESQCDRDSIEYVKAVRCVFQVNPVDTLKCLTSKNKEQDASLKKKRV